MSSVMTWTNEMILDELKNGSGNGKTVWEIQEALGCNHETVRRRLLSLIEEKKVSRRMDSTNGKRSYVYEVIESDEKKEAVVEKPERYGDNKNDEGYSDPTAAAAIRSASSHKETFLPGAIYKTGFGDPFLVIRTYPDCELGYYVREVPNAVSTDTTVVWLTKNGSHLVYVNQIMSVPHRKLQGNTFERIPMEAYRDILRKSPLQAAKHIEVPVEKIVEVEKEVIKEVPAELTEQKCIEFIRESGWLKEHDEILEIAAKIDAMDDLSTEDHIKALRESGWLEEHDKEMSTVITATIPKKVVTTSITSAIPKEVVNEMLELELLKQKASIYENILQAMISGWKK